MPSKLFQAGLLDGQVAIVSGGGSGLGRASALELAALGAQVIVCGRREEPLDETAEQADVGRVEARPCDIREEDQVEALVDGVIERHGRIDLLVNNAGGQYMTPAEDITPKGFRTVMRLNVEGTWLMTHAVATRAMMGRDGEEPRGGKILNVTLSPHHGLPGMANMEGYKFSTPKGTDYAWGGALVLIVIVMLLNLIARVIGKIFAPKTGR